MDERLWGGVAVLVPRKSVLTCLWSRWVFLNFTLRGLGLSLWGFIQKPPVPPLSIGPDRLCTFPDTQRAEYPLIKEQNHLRVEGLGFSKPDTV